MRVNIAETETGEAIQGDEPKDLSGRSDNGLWHCLQDNQDVPVPEISKGQFTDDEWMD